jgi:lipopolysaccharide export LptBFGC system permease protein LptF
MKITRSGSQVEKGRFSRNWKWIVPAVCFGIVISMVAFVAAIFLISTAFIKSSETYQQALIRVRSNEAAVRRLGEPIEAGWFLNWRIKISNGSTIVYVWIPVSGPKRSGTIHARASREEGRWVSQSFTLEVKGERERINLTTDSGQ